jgi:hypothetical protein
MECNLEDSHSCAVVTDLQNARFTTLFVILGGDTVNRTSRVGVSIVFLLVIVGHSNVRR